MSVGRFDGAIGDAYHVQYHIIVVFVGFMAVSVPIRRSFVDFDVADPQLSANFDFGVEEIGSRIVVVQSRVMISSESPSTVRIGSGRKSRCCQA